MNGVKILSQEIIYNTILPDWCIALGFFGMIIFIIALVVALADGYNGLAWVCGVVVIVSTSVLCLSIMPSKTDISHIEYKVIIDETVSMVEFMNKYEILNQEGAIYTIKERE